MITFITIAIDLSKQQVLQENKDLIQQINFIGRLEAAANVFIIIENINYGVNKDTDENNPDTIKYDTRVLKPNLCDYAEAYILIDGTN